MDNSTNVIECIILACLHTVYLHDHALMQLCVLCNITIMCAAINFCCLGLQLPSVRTIYSSDNIFDHLGQVILDFLF